jgi:hypothetical protein
MSRIFFVNVWRKNNFDICVTEYGTALTTIFTYFVPVFKYCYSDSRNLWTVMNIFTSHLDKKIIDIFNFFIFVHFHYMKMHRL